MSATGRMTCNIYLTGHTIAHIRGNEDTYEHREGIVASNLYLATSARNKTSKNWDLVFITKVEQDVKLI